MVSAGVSVSRKCLRDRLFINCMVHRLTDCKVLSLKIRFGIWRMRRLDIIEIRLSCTCHPGTFGKVIQTDNVYFHRSSSFPDLTQSTGLWIWDTWLLLFSNLGFSPHTSVEKVMYSFAFLSLITHWPFRLFFWGCLRSCRLVRESSISYETDRTNHW